MTTYRAVIAERADVAVVTVLCECGAALSLRIETVRIPMQCASCGKQYDDHIRGALAGLERFHREATTAEEKNNRKIFQFEVRLSDDNTGKAQKK